MKKIISAVVLCLLLVSCGPPQDGHGTHEFDNGTKYVGEWKGGKAHGQGTATFADGGKYVGEWKDGKYHGQGTFTFVGGDKYVGEWKDGKYHGQGTSTFVGGDKYVGEWKDGEFHGQGTYTYPDGDDGDKYVGEFKDDKFHGQGTLTYGDGGKYVGEFKDGEQHGQGTATYSDGRKSVGEWKYGIKQESTNYDKDGNVIAPSPENDFDDAMNAHMVRDYETALRKFRLLAETEGKLARPAQSLLGNMYVHGYGVPQDNVYAYMWWHIANYETEGKLALAKEMTPAQIEKAEKLASECIAKKYKGC